MALCVFYLIFFNGLSFTYACLCNLFLNGLELFYIILFNVPHFFYDLLYD